MANSGFIVTGRNMTTMQRVFYTGRAGSGFVSSNQADAFTYRTGEEAERKARMLSRGQTMHVFYAAYANPDDAHAAGAAAMSAEMCGE